MDARTIRRLIAAPAVLAVARGALFPIASGAAAPARDQGPEIVTRVREYHTELRDMSATMEVKHENDAALRKISSDFAQLVRYGFRTLKYSYKEPDKVRMESTARFFHFLKGISVRNGDHKNFYVPSLRIHRTADVTGQPNKKETSLDFGLLDGDVWTLYRVWYIRSERFEGQEVYVLGVKPDNGRLEGSMIVRIDPATLKVLERDRYNPDGKLQQRVYYTQFVHVLPHVWLPTIIKLYNAQGEFGGDLYYSHYLVNSNLPDSLFH